MVLDLYFPHKPRGNPAAMFLKGFGKTISYLLFAFGFFLLNLIFPSLIILFLGYYSFPSGIADMDKYNIVQGIFKSFMAIVMTIFTFMFLGGPVQFKLVLSALIIAFFFTIPSAYGEMATLIIFVFASIIALFLGAISLGAPPQSIIGLALILVSLLFYMVSKLGEKEKQQEEEREEKEKKKKLELEEKELEAKEEKVEKEEKGYVESKGQIYSKGGGKWSTCPKCKTQVNIEHYTKCPTCGYDMSKLPKKEEK